MNDFHTALSTLPKLLHKDLLIHWELFQDNAARQQLEMPDNPAFWQQLVQVWGSSEFVARACIREPDLLLELSQQQLQSPCHAQQLRDQLTQALAGCEDNDSLLSERLRTFRRRQMARIAWRDLAGIADVTTILRELSDLADVILDETLQRLYDGLCQRYGTPRGEDGEPQQLIVLGMGKLGGQELNFSSDIDLIFAFPQRGQSDGSKSIDNEDFFRRLSQKLIKLLSEMTAEGFVYRVDMRLRPFGASGPLAIPFSAFEDYYQTHGREWERYAMIKARVVAGDKAQGELLLQSLQPFVYRRYLDYGAFESLRQMKALIAQEVERKGLRRNVKLGPGGIREIEFIGQAFQLIYGGREPELRQRSLLPVLDYLAASGRLSEDTVDALQQAYFFLRRTENRLQAWSDQQTHNLPLEKPAKLRLAYSMGCSDWPVFVSELLAHVANVKEQFQLVFAAEQTEHSQGGSSGVDLGSLWDDAKPDEDSLAQLREQGFAAPEQALRSLQRLHDSFSYRALSQQGRARLHQLLPLLLHTVSQVEQPETTLDRLVHLLEAIARRSVYLALLVESPVALNQLVKLCAASPLLADYLSRYPLLLDELLNPATLYQPLGRSGLEQELERELSRAGDNDEERRVDALRHFKQTNELRVAAADITGVINLMEVSDHLTEIAEVVLSRVLTLAWSELIARFGRPRCLIEGQPYEPALAIIAYGKLGGIELGYGSDLDLVFLHDSSGEQQYTDGAKQIDNASFFAKLAQRIIHWLSAHTTAGVLYEVDTRLRPSGRSGLLVSSFSAFAEYQRHQAWTWEHQALVRTRVIAGPKRLNQRFQELRQEILCQPRERTKLRQEVKEMRERMRLELGNRKPGMFHVKQDRGGIADVEFIVQYAVLAYAHDEPLLARHSDNIRQISALEVGEILTSFEASQLRDSYRNLRRRAHQLRLQEQGNLVEDSDLSEERESVIRIWQKLLETDSA
ncbi:MAG: bifunctional [glutamate--ammonia ligase]-adenylyl-L-tyrosine phosphorylase/[glutamate--ammonia-ligase] adenylyltransferase [Gammaproteobacteria bacterium]